MFVRCRRKDKPCVSRKNGIRNIEKLLFLSLSRFSLTQFAQESTLFFRFLQQKIKELDAVAVFSVLITIAHCEKQISLFWSLIFVVSDNLERESRVEVQFEFIKMSSSSNQYDLSFKILLIGDSGVGKSSLLVSFVSDSMEDLPPTIGVDFKIKQLTVGGKRLKLTIWDTAGQERFRTLTSSYYRGAQGIILVYDVTRRETFTNLSDIWAKELDLYSTKDDCVKMLVGNKVDKDAERFVRKEEGIALAKELGCLFLECSAKTLENVHQCFEELALKIMEVPSLLEEGSTVVKRNILTQKPEEQATPSGGCCS